MRVVPDSCKSGSIICLLVFARATSFSAADFNHEFAILLYEQIDTF